MQVLTLLIFKLFKFEVELSFEAKPISELCIFRLSISTKDFSPIENPLSPQL